MPRYKLGENLMGSLWIETERADVKNDVSRIENGKFFGLSVVSTVP